MSHQQIKLYEGIYLTDFRVNAKLKGMEAHHSDNKDVNLIMDDLHQLENKINKLVESIEYIKEEEDWDKDEVYVDSVREDYELMLKYADEMVEVGQKVVSTGYAPEKVEDKQVLDKDRILKRKEKSREQFWAFSSKYLKAAPEASKQDEEDEGVFV